MHERQNSRLACLQEEEVPAPFDPRERPKSCVKQAILKVLDSYWTTGFMLALTIFALFGDDIRTSAFTIKADNVFFSLSTACLFFFSLEVILASWVKPTYRWSFFFYLDAISALSIIPDIAWIWDHIVDTKSLGSGSKINQVQTAGVTSRAGARTTRIIRVIRIIRLVRLSKLYKNARMTIRQQSNSLRVTPDDEYSIPEESKIGKKLNELTIKRVIVLVLGLLLLLPLFDVGFFQTTYTSWEYGTEDLANCLNNPGFITAREMFIDYHKNDLRPLVFLSTQIDSMVAIWTANTSLNDLRLSEKYYALQGRIVAVFDIRADTIFSAQLSICQTLFICLVLTLGAIYLTQDATELVITPIEKMIDKVRRIAKNPLAAMNDKMKDLYDLEDQIENPSVWQRCFYCKRKKLPKGLETSLLEDAIMKIGALLALGFGEAGAQIIADNLSKQSSINPIADGTKVLALFAFCDIRNFTDTTEVLQERVMVFVNEIAGIVHHTVDEYVGAANKNVGDAFLLVWKYPKEYTTQRDSKLYLIDSPYVNSYADLALLAVLKIIAKINSSISILKYREYPELKKRMPNYSVKLGFGLHMGWAIEGAIGSEFKVDASYLSPNVNLTSKLEELTKVYGVPLIISSAAYGVFSDFMKKRCRHIDTMKLPAAHKPLRLYTYDISVTRLFPNDQKPFDKEASKEKRREKQQRLSDDKLEASDLLYKSKKLRSISESLLPGCIDSFERGLNEYEAGNWQSSKELIEQSLEFKPADGPSQALLSYMKEFGFQAPEDWPGYRTLFGH